MFPSYIDESSGEFKKWGRSSREGVILKCDIDKNKILSYNLNPVFQKRDDPIIMAPSVRVKNKILKKIKLMSKEYQKYNYNVRYDALIKKEKKFGYVKFNMEMLDAYGLKYTLSKARKKVFRIKNLKI